MKGHPMFIRLRKVKLKLGGSGVFTGLDPDEKREYVINLNVNHITSYTYVDAKTHSGHEYRYVSLWTSNGQSYNINETYESIGEIIQQARLADELATAKILFDAQEEGRDLI